MAPQSPRQKVLDKARSFYEREGYRIRFCEDHSIFDLIGKGPFGDVYVQIFTEKARMDRIDSVYFPKNAHPEVVKMYPNQKDDIPANLIIFPIRRSR